MEKSRKGYTLVETLIEVLCIMGFLGVIVILSVVAWGLFRF